MAAVLAETAHARQVKSAAAPDRERQAAIAARLAALEGLDNLVKSLPDYRGQAGLKPLDDSGVSRADFYGYTEREDAQL